MALQVRVDDFVSMVSDVLRVLNGVSVIVQVFMWDPSYQDVAQQFTQQWKHPTPVPYIIKIWKIYPDPNVVDRFSRYQQRIEQSRGIPGGNTRRRFHGTVRLCRIGDTPSDNTFCTLSNCNLCRIVQSSFQVARAGQRTNFGRFGAGIYSSATSSKANDYSSSGSASPNKAMLLNDVVMGRAVKLTRTNTSLMQPPPGFDAVIGEPGGDLNYDECVVYTNDAVRPSFLIIYR